MDSITPPLKFFLNLAKVQSVLTRRFDSGLGGLGLSDFMILYHLRTAEGEKLRRIDLAEKIGLTASGVTRLLAPMEKVGLVKREIHKDDARVSYVLLAPGGRRRFNETIERAELISDELLEAAGVKKVSDFSDILVKLGGTVK